MDSKALTLMRLANRDSDPNGWAPVSAQIWPLMALVPDDLMDKKPSDQGGFVRLTAQGHTVLKYT